MPVTRVVKINYFFTNAETPPERKLDAKSAGASGGEREPWQPSIGNDCDNGLPLWSRDPKLSNRSKRLASA